MLKLKESLVRIGQRSVSAFVLIMASTMMLFAQKSNEKFSMTTQMFLNELNEQAKQPAKSVLNTPNLNLVKSPNVLKHHRLIASPDTIGGVAYISCFIHLKDTKDLSKVRSLGVEIEETFDGLDFVTARVPVKELEALADIDNVTRIKVAQLMRPMTDVARQKTNVDDILALSSDAIAAGVNTKFDGTGVVLGIIDTGIDFQHIAFKDKDGNSRIKGAYVYDGSSAQEYTTITSTEPTTDDEGMDHGTHTASTAGGSSVNVNDTIVTVTDNHAATTYGGIAPGADLYLAGVKDLNNTYLVNALNKIVAYADEQGKPLVVSNSWGSTWGPHDGTGEWADLVSQHFGDNHPNRVILFAAANDAGRSIDNEGGGLFVRKSDATSSSPLGTILRSPTYTNADAGLFYYGVIASAWSSSKLNCRLHVLNNHTGASLKSWTVTESTSSFDGLSTYYGKNDTLDVLIQPENGKYHLAVVSNGGLLSDSMSVSDQYYTSEYTLAIEVYPESGSDEVKMFSGLYTYFSNHLSTPGYTWTEGTDDMSVSDESTIPDAICVGAYVSKKNWTAYDGNPHEVSVYTEGDIAYFSSYATAEQSPTGEAYPWITAPGARLAAGVNHYHTTAVDSRSYYNNSNSLVVNNSNYPYAMMEGTSMATPVAAGIVALWLQAAKSVGKDLTVSDVKEIMAQTAITDNYTTTGPNATHFGKGKIDALAGIQYILRDETTVIAADTIDFTAQQFTDQQAVSTVNGTNCTVTFDKGTNSNPPKYYNNGTAIRMYGGNTMTISSTTRSIVKIELTFGSSDGSNTINTDVPTYSNGTWTGDASSVTFSIGGTSGNRRIKKVIVTYSGIDPTIAYYQNADGKKGSELKTAMSGIIFNRTEQSYDNLWTAFMTTDVRSDGKIWDMYSNTTNYTPVTSGSSYSQEGDCYNREHSFPQSWFGSNIPMYTDLHHIYPTDGFVNGKRANYPFGETSSPTYTSNNDFSKLGTCSYPGYTGVVFEPADEYKGDFARTYFYMVTCYEEKLHDWYNDYGSTEVTAVIDGSTYPALTDWQLSMLMKWSKNDPVSEKETNRNDAVYAIQSNRNPFIDYPGLEEYVWGSLTSSAFSYDNYLQPVYMSFSPSEATATIGEDFTEPTLIITPSGLTVSYSSSNDAVATVNATTGDVTLVADGTTTITATFAGNDSYNVGSASYTLTVSAASTSVTGRYELVTDASTLKANDKILIAYVSGNNKYVLSTTQNNNNRAATTDVTLNTDGTLTPGDTAQVITLEKDGSNYLFNVGDGYLYAASSGSNWLRTKTQADNNAKATVSINSGNATIIFQGSNTRNIVRYNPNNGNPVFSCYASNSTTGSLPQIYRELTVPSIALNNDGTGNAGIIEANNGRMVNVTLSNRTLFKDSYWNTLCLPFKLTIAGSILDGADVRTLSNASFEDGTLTLNFTPENGVTELVAGTPYIIKWASGSNIVDPVFENVVISNASHDFESADGKVQFKGLYDQLSFDADDKSILFMGETNTLYYPVTGAVINAFRAYFKLTDSSLVKQFVLDFSGEDDPTGISEYLEKSDSSESWYDLNGRKLSGKPTKKGIYIHNGIKTVK